MTARSHGHILLALALACSGSHGPDCPAVAGSCLDECCARPSTPSFDAECNPICPAGTSLVDRCAPRPGCSACVLDAGPPPRCEAGPCCDRFAAATLGASCAYECPAGFSLDCAPDPSARCPAPWSTCTVPSDCALVPAECCLPCDAVTLEDVEAVSDPEAHRAARCPGGAACPPCVPPEHPSLVATCRSSICSAIDVRRDPVSACASDAECRVRVSDCCECGADARAERLIAIRADAEREYAAMVCDPSAACAECAPAYPPTVEAFCAADGHCAVRDVGP